MPPDPQAQAVLDQIAALGFPPRHTQPHDVVRRQYAERMALMPPGEPVARVEAPSIPGTAGAIPARVYTPAGDPPFPALVYFHGGGWVIGDIDTHDAVCRQLTNAAGCVVISVDYRLAPEHRFPAAAEDAYAATRWVAENAASLGVDPERIAVGGDSAGGNLAAVVTLMARDAGTPARGRGGPPLAYQLLIYPVTDHDFDTESYRANAEGYLLTKADMVWFWNHYLPDEAQRNHPYASPLRAPDLRGLPPALVITAEYDPLRDEGAAYATRLRAAGVPAIHRDYEGVFHGFFSMSAQIDKARQAVRDAADALRSAFAAQPVT